MEEKKFLKNIQTTLQSGLLISFIFLISGFFLKIFYGRDFNFLKIAIIVLMLTPFARVIMLLYLFFKKKEYNFSFISFIVFCLMIVSILL
jgi:hypothetical protein